MANNILEDHALEAQGDIMDTSTKAMLDVAQAILMKMPYTCLEVPKQLNLQFQWEPR